jgi:hypothetical protein
MERRNNMDRYVTVKVGFKSYLLKRQDERWSVFKEWNEQWIMFAEDLDGFADAMGAVAMHYDENELFELRS